MPPSTLHVRRTRARPPRWAVLAMTLLVLAVATAGAGVAAGPTADPPTGAPSACGATDRPTASPTASDGNVSVSVWTAPGESFGEVGNASQLRAATDAGWVTPVDDTTGDLARGDVLALRVNLSGDATAVLDDLAAASGDTPEERFAELVGEPGVRDRGFDLALRTGMCWIPVDWSRTADRGALNVVVDRTNDGLYVALDTDRAVTVNSEGPALHSHTRIEVQPPGASEPRHVRTVDPEFGSVSFGDGDPAEVPGTSGVPLQGTTNLAPGTLVSFRVSAVGADYSTRFEARVRTNGTLETTLDLSSVPPETRLFVRPGDERLSETVVVVTGPSTSTASRSPTPTPTPVHPSTLSPSPTPTPPSTPTTSPTATSEPSPTPGPTPTTTPGLGPRVALAALLLAAVARHRR